MRGRRGRRPRERARVKQGPPWSSVPGCPWEALRYPGESVSRPWFLRLLSLAWAPQAHRRRQAPVGTAPTASLAPFSLGDFSGSQDPGTGSALMTPKSLHPDVQPQRLS